MRYKKSEVVESWAMVAGIVIALTLLFLVSTHRIRI